MPDIKTRDIAKGTIKTIDKSAVAAERMKSAFIQTKEKAEHSVDVPESSAEEYASNRLESGIPPHCFRGHQRSVPLFLWSG